MHLKAVNYWFANDTSIPLFLKKKSNPSLGAGKGHSREIL
jgi:hypothetical protein